MVTRESSSAVAKSSRIELSSVEMPLIAVPGNPRVIVECARLFGRGNFGPVSHVAQLDGVVLAVTQRESDGALVHRLEQVVERGH